MTEKTYIYIQKIFIFNSGREQDIVDVQGSQKELESLLKKYNIKSHNQNSSIEKFSDRISVIYISHHYILTPIFNNKV